MHELNEPIKIAAWIGDITLDFGAIKYIDG
jgi:hypothetical protein